MKDPARTLLTIDSRARLADNVYSKPWNNGEIEGPEGRGRDWTYVSIPSCRAASPEAILLTPTWCNHRDVPRPTVERQDCVDCAGWKFV